MPVMSRPSNTIVPEVGGISQVSILKNVRLAGAVGADDAAQLAVADGEIDVAVGDEAAIALGQAGRLQDRPGPSLGCRAPRRDRGGRRVGGRRARGVGSFTVAALSDAVSVALRRIAR